MTENFSFDEAAKKNHSEPKGMGWLLPLLFLVLLSGLIFYFSNSSHKPVIAPQFINTDTVISPQPVVVAKDSAMNHEVQIQLSDTVLTVQKGSIEYRLALYISSDKKEDSAGKSQIFEFDDISFKDYTAVLTDSSMRRIQNVAAIIKRYPAVKIRITCYTNETNNDAANLELSKQRANSVAVALTKYGAKETQILSLEGLGSDNKRAVSSDTRVKRASVFLQVTAK